MAGSFEPPQTTADNTAVLIGKAPVAEMSQYGAEVLQYTRGKGRLSCHFCGYEECHNAETVISAFDYDAERDTDNPCDSVFCSELLDMGGVLREWNPDKFLNSCGIVGVEINETALDGSEFLLDYFVDCCFDLFYVGVIKVESDNITGLCVVIPVLHFLCQIMKRGAKTIVETGSL